MKLTQKDQEHVLRHHQLITHLLNFFVFAVFDCTVCIFQNYRQCMAGLLVPPYGVMDSVPNADSKYKHLSSFLKGLFTQTMIRVSKCIHWCCSTHACVGGGIYLSLSVSAYRTVLAMHERKRPVMNLLISP